MSFRLFIYYCAAWGAAAALAGWVLGLPFPGSSVAGAGVKALCLGALLGLVLTCVEAVGGSGTLRRTWELVPRVIAALAVGAAGGWTGGTLAQFLFTLYNRPAFFVLCWALTGLLIGAAPAAFDVISALFDRRGGRGAGRKARNGLLGGATGGLLGGAMALALKAVGSQVFAGRDADKLWTPTAAGAVALGASIGLAVGLAQVILKEAWLRVESGFRPGRQLILSRQEFTIGRAESCDLGLFGDPGVERVHARILRKGGGFVLADADTTGGTFVNDERIDGETPLSSGDHIRIGANVLSFGERQRRQAGGRLSPAPTRSAANR
jgi:MFS family permease